MPNPPYSTVVLIVGENEDGGTIECFAYNDTPPKQPVAKGAMPGIVNSLFLGIDPPKDDHVQRNFSGLSDLKAKVDDLFDEFFPDTQP